MYVHSVYGVYRDVCTLILGPPPPRLAKADVLVPRRLLENVELLELGPETVPDEPQPVERVLHRQRVVPLVSRKVVIKGSVGGNLRERLRPPCEVHAEVVEPLVDEVVQVGPALDARHRVGLIEQLHHLALHPVARVVEGRDLVDQLGHVGGMREARVVLHGHHPGLDEGLLHDDLVQNHPPQHPRLHLEPLPAPVDERLPRKELRVHGQGRQLPRRRVDEAHAEDLLGVPTGRLDVLDQRVERHVDVLAPEDDRLLEAELQRRRHQRILVYENGEERHHLLPRLPRGAPLVQAPSVHVRRVLLDVELHVGAPPRHHGPLALLQLPRPRRVHRLDNFLALQTAVIPYLVPVEVLRVPLGAGCLVGAVAGRARRRLLLLFQQLVVDVVDAFALQLLVHRHVVLVVVVDPPRDHLLPLQTFINSAPVRVCREPRYAATTTCIRPPSRIRRRQERRPAAYGVPEVIVGHGAIVRAVPRLLVGTASRHCHTPPAFPAASVALPNHPSTPNLYPVPDSKYARLIAETDRPGFSSARGRRIVQEPGVSKLLRREGRGGAAPGPGTGPVDVSLRARSAHPVKRHSGGNFAPPERGPQPLLRAGASRG
ncbi:CHAT domain-containing protein [Babesia caballi]|uniref:CHAT domain-containing protein n=1 Tax=Babesia caballi TaxID=5871 RepID=A0AAV4M1B5_BABCB|nr:CHAT domain-containing protein [Babesia caballi]